MALGILGKQSCRNAAQVLRYDLDFNAGGTLKTFRGKHVISQVAR